MFSWLFCMRTENSLTSVSNAQGRLPKGKKKNHTQPKKKKKRERQVGCIPSFRTGMALRRALLTAPLCPAHTAPAARGKSHRLASQLKRIILQRAKLCFPLRGEVGSCCKAQREIMPFNVRVQIFQHRFSCLL